MLYFKEIKKAKNILTSTK